MPAYLRVGLVSTLTVEKYPHFGQCASAVKLMLFQLITPIATLIERPRQAPSPLTTTCLPDVVREHPTRHVNRSNRSSPAIPLAPLDILPST